MFTVAIYFRPEVTEDHPMQKALAPEISTWPDANPQLIGSKCGNCAATVFPVQPRCPRCSVGDMSELPLPRRGTLVAWTTQGFPPGAPYKGPVGKDFVPFGVGLVQLDDVIREGTPPKTTRPSSSSAWRSS
jgi:uncharacterized OB-fold protein